MVTSYDQPPLLPSHWWQGRSGRWYIHTIFPINALPELWACNYILARPKWDGTREPFYIGQTKDGETRLGVTRHEKFAPALRLGASELHAHFLANSRQERLDIETDLRHGHYTPLNEQSTPALVAGFGGLAALGNPFAGIGVLNHLPASPPSGDLNALVRALTSTL
jgi:hypothetical protein